MSHSLTLFLSPSCFCLCADIAGPSAGISLTLSLLSLVLDSPVLADLAVTGELSLTGQVCAVGGIKEKLLAAKRAHVRQLVLPSLNRASVDEIAETSPELLENLTVHYVAHISQVLPIAFPHLAPLINPAALAFAPDHEAVRVLQTPLRPADAASSSA